MKSVTIVLAILFVFLTFVPQSFSHCEIPCGIYGDAMRMNMIAEHIQTIEKSMNKINELSKEKEINYNQLVRWITNKEKHAEELQEIMWQYFMAQRIKPVEDKNSAAYKTYLKQLTLAHELIIYAMKAKQSVDLQYIKKLEKALADFRVAYPIPKK